MQKHSPHIQLKQPSLLVTARANYIGSNRGQNRYGFGLSPKIFSLQSTQPSGYWPRVSVLIPAYNAAALIARTLESVVTQTYCNLEILVVDDGSCDRTPAIVRAFSQRDSRIRLLQQSNAGVAAARNLGIQNAQGEFIAPLDADDLWHPEAIAKLVAQFQAGGPELGVVYAWSRDIDQRDQLTGGFHAATVDGDVYKTLICHNFLGNASATLIRKACLDRVGGYDTQLKAQNAQGCEDWDLYLRLAEHYEFGVVPEFLVDYRKVSSSMSGDFIQMARSQQLMLQTIQHKHPEIPGFLYRLSRSSFYLYLAQQCDLQGNAHATLCWLWQAIRVDPITPLGRLGVYRLLIKNLAKQLLGDLPRFSQQETTTMPNLAEANQSLIAASSYDSAPTNHRKINRFKIWLKVFVSAFLHQSLLRV
ncbi:MAG: glycosyltransferase family 2 protein [Cyanothece sp. SIO1E1]|nr:glycosyltransferase family 2 protein [Cyanothece sp. SIO1E1]